MLNASKSGLTRCRSSVPTPCHLLGLVVDYKQLIVLSSTIFTVRRVCLISCVFL
jgi:homospermidine synthase